MTRWQQRSVVYKLTLAFLYFIFLVYALAFSIPAWLGFRGSDNVIFGLWAVCGKISDRGDFKTCFKNAFGDDSDWMDGVRAVWLAGMFFYVLTVLYSFIDNCCIREDRRDYGVTGILAIIAVNIATDIDQTQSETDEQTEWASGRHQTNDCTRVAVAPDD